MQNNHFDYWMPTRIHFQKDSSLHMRDSIEGNNVLILISKTLYKNGTAEAIAKSLKDKNITFYCDIESDPSTECVDRAVIKAKAIQATTIIGIGGGSCLDVSKAIACLVNSSMSIKDYMNGKSIDKRHTKLILVPTTAGTGSEVTSVGVYTDKSKGVKVPVLSPEFYADEAFLDPTLTYTTPPKVSANTGMDAFCHALESYWNANSNPISDALAKAAIQLIFKNIGIVYHSLNHQEARENMMLASLLAGLAFAQTRTTGAHVLSYPLSAMYHCAHGESCAITLPAFIRLSHEIEADKMKALETSLGFENQEEFAQAVESILEELHMPTRLSQLGVQKKDVDKIVKDAMSYKKQLDLTPAKMDEDSLKKLLLSIL